MAFANISINVDEELKAEAETIYRGLGLNLARAITAFLQKTVDSGAVPFDLPSQKPVDERPLSETDRRSGEAILKELLNDARSERPKEEVRENEFRIVEDMNSLSKCFYILTRKNGQDYYAPEDLDATGEPLGKLSFGNQNKARSWLRRLKDEHNAYRVLVERANLPVNREGFSDQRSMASQNRPIFPQLGRNNQQYRYQPQTVPRNQPTSSNSRNHKAPKFTFEDYEIPIGAVLEFTKGPRWKAKVADGNNKVRFEDKMYSISGLAIELNVRCGYKRSKRQGPAYFSYKGEKLTDRRRRMDGDRGR